MMMTIYSTIITIIITQETLSQITPHIGLIKMHFLLFVEVSDLFPSSLGTLELRFLYILIVQFCLRHAIKYGMFLFVNVG